jgi:hypothetical protein
MADAAGEIERMLVRAPARVANASRNANAGRDRRRRWEPARDALWDFVAPVLDDGARVAVVGAGNGDTVPLRRIAREADGVALIDIDPRAADGARRRLPRAGRRKTEVIGHDVTAGAADAIVLSVLHDPDATPGGERAASDAGDLGHLNRRSDRPLPRATGDPLPGAPYDLVIGDLFYSQLLYPALLDLGVDGERIDAAIAAHGPPLTRAAVARLHASAPLAVHVHDPLAWWDGHEQPVSLEEVLGRADGEGAEAALALAARGSGPRESDPRAPLADLGLTPVATALWRWPFREGVDYLACATLARGA